MVNDGDRTTWGARVLAPLAFFAAATVLVLLVHNSLNAGTDDEPPAAAERAAGANGGNGERGTGGGNQAGAGNEQEGPRQRRRFYRIKPGDTLDKIAPQFDTTVDDLLQLNPGIDPNALTPGQRIRIR